MFFLRFLFSFRSPTTSVQDWSSSHYPIACESIACKAWAASLVVLVLSVGASPTVKDIFIKLLQFIKLFRVAIDQTFLLTLAALALPAFWGVNAGFPWPVCRKGLWSRRSPGPPPEALKRSEWENHVIEKAKLLLAILSWTRRTVEDCKWMLCGVMNEYNSGLQHN